MTAAVATIGFTRTSAENFFARLRKAKVKRVIDVRLHNTSQLAGFAKADDLAYFLKTINGMDYVPEPSLAPTEELMKFFKTDKGDWNVFARDFSALMKGAEDREGAQALLPRRRLPALLRGDGASLPQAAGRGVPERGMGRGADRRSSVGRGQENLDFSVF